MSQASERQRYRASLERAGLTGREIRGLHIVAGRLQRANELDCASVPVLRFAGSLVTPSQYVDIVRAEARRWLWRANRRLTASYRGPVISGSGPTGPLEMEFGEVRGCSIRLRGRGLPCTSFGGEGWFNVWCEGYTADDLSAVERATQGLWAGLSAETRAKIESEAPR